jgi:hypothetical protein
MQNIKLRFVTCGDLVSALIRDKTFCAYSHVEFVLNDGTTLGAHAEGGVAIRPANYDNFTKIAVFNVPVATDEVKASILAFAMAQVGKPYDFGAIAGLVLNRDWRNTSKSWWQRRSSRVNRCCGLLTAWTGLRRGMCCCRFA